MKQDEDVRTPEGLAAWEFYRLWLNKNRRKARNINSFMGSQYYKAFIRFAKFVKKTALPQPDYFIDFMNLKRYDPRLWTDSRVYQAYLEHLDLTGDPMDRFAATIKSLQKLANEAGCEIKDVFDHLTPPEMVHKIYSRELSPWFLIHSAKFWDFYKNKTAPSDQVRLEGLIRLPFWKERFARHPDVHNDMKTMVKRLNL